MTFNFPTIDPIPLPAPVWLFKILHNLTLTLHFAFLHLLVGGLFLAVLWNAIGHLRKSPLAISSSGMVAARLPIVMTFVINLGIPPLLFTQVLYGRAFYTSSILIGVYWISVLLFILTTYFILYYMGGLAERKKAWWFWGLLASALLLHVASVYTTNMTLMLRPEVWPNMYDASVYGTHMPPLDPTQWPRFAVMMAASISLGALGSALYTGKKALADEVKIFFRFWSGVISLIALPVLAALGLWAFQTQPDFVQDTLQVSPFYQILLYGWLGCLGLSFLAALALVLQPKSWSFTRGLLTALPAFLSVAVYELIRDGVRDITLAHKGFDVWASPVNTNWPIVGLFLGFFIAGLGVMIWILKVLRLAKPAEENYA
jgi:hypothetical protein